MNKLRKNQQGFSAVEVVLVLVIVILIGVVGWFVYKNHHKTTTTSSTVSTTKTVTSNSAPKTTSATTNTNATATSYFTIREWGVRAPYTGQDTFTYTLSNNNNLATIISKDLATKDSGCSTYGAGQIKRLLPTDGSYEDGTGPSVASAAQSDPSLYTHVGGYYYLFVHDQAECGNISIQDQNQANSAVQALVTNFQAVPN